MTDTNADKKNMEASSGTATAGPADLDLRKKSRIAAFWYLLILVTGPIVMIYLPTKFLVPGDAAATIANIMASQALYRLWIVIGFISSIAFLFTGLALHALFKAVDKGQARIMVVLVALSVSIGFISSLFQMAVLRLGGGADYLKAFTPAQLQSLAMIFLDIDKQGNFVANIFWGLWLLPLGILIFKSGFFPKILGVLEWIAGFGYLASFLVGFLFPGIRSTINPIITVMLFGELPFIFWLIIRGARLRSPHKAMTAGT
jgi:hypothetical protein